MLQPKESRDLKKTYKRLCIFLVIAFIIDAFLAFVLYKYAKVGEILVGFIIIVWTTLLYLLFLWICAKIDKKKKDKIEKAGKKDPFSKN